MKIWRIKRICLGMELKIQIQNERKKAQVITALEAFKKKYEKKSVAALKAAWFGKPGAALKRLGGAKARGNLLTS